MKTFGVALTSIMILGALVFNIANSDYIMNSNPLFDFVSNTTVYSNNINTGDSQADYGITDQQLSDFLNHVDENGNYVANTNGANLTNIYQQPNFQNNNIAVQNTNNTPFQNQNNTQYTNNTQVQNTNTIQDQNNNNYNNSNTNNSYTNTNNQSQNTDGSDPNIKLGYSVYGYPCTVLRSFMNNGSRGEEVRALQIFLFAKGYLATLPDGQYGPSTRSAILNYQKDNGVDVRGYVGPYTRTQVAKDTCGDYQPALSTAFKGIPAAPKRVSVAQPKPQPAPQSYDQPNIAQAQEQIQPQDLQPDNNISTTPSNRISSFTGTNPTDYSLIKYNINAGEKPYICIDAGSNNICNSNNNFALLQEYINGDNYDATFLKDQKQWLISIYYDSKWSNGGKVVLSNKGFKTEYIIG